MWSSSGSPATLPRHTAGSSAPVDWDSLLPLLPESVRLLRQVLEDDAALHRLLEHCGGLTLRIPRRFPSEGHLLRALLPEPVLRTCWGLTAAPVCISPAAPVSPVRCASGSCSAPSAAIPPPVPPAMPRCAFWPAGTASRTGASGSCSSRRPNCRTRPFRPPATPFRADPRTSLSGRTGKAAAFPVFFVRRLLLAGACPQGRMRPAGLYTGSPLRRACLASPLSGPAPSPSLPVPPRRFSY